MACRGSGGGSCGTSASGGVAMTRSGCRLGVGVGSCPLVVAVGAGTKRRGAGVGSGRALVGGWG